MCRESFWVSSVDASVFASPTGLDVEMFMLLLMRNMGYSMNSSNTIRYCLDVLNFNRFFLKVIRVIHN